MLEWFMNLDMITQLSLAAIGGMILGSIFSWFGEIVTPDDLI